MLGVDRHRRAVGRDVGGSHLVVVPDVAALGHGHVAVDALHDDDLLHRGRPADGLVGVGLGSRRLGAAVALVGADEHLGAAVVDAGLEGVGAEAAEHHHVDGADARARQHDDGQLGDHRHVEGDTVALLHAVLLQHVGEPADLVEELLVGVRRGVARVALEDDGRLVTLARLDPTVETVVARVELAAQEPLDARHGIEAPLEHLVPLLRPDQRLLGAVGPVPLGILDGAFVLGRELGLALEIGALRELGRRRNHYLLVSHPVHLHEPYGCLSADFPPACLRAGGVGDSSGDRRGTRIPRGGTSQRDVHSHRSVMPLRSWTRRAGRRQRASRSFGEGQSHTLVSTAGESKQWGRRGWWAMLDLNQRPPACEAGALPLS